MYVYGVSFFFGSYVIMFMPSADLSSNLLTKNSAFVSMGAGLSFVFAYAAFRVLRVCARNFRAPTDE